MKGIGASKGIGIGKAYIKEELPVIEETIIEDTEKEIAHLKECITKVSEDIGQLYQEKLEILGEKDAQIFKAHQMIIEDPELLNKIEDEILNHHYSAAYAAKLAIDSFVQMFEMMDNDYFKERALDMKDVGKRLKAKLLGLEMLNLGDIVDNRIIIAKDLTPSDTAQLNSEAIEGIITEEGGKTSHSAIIARTMGIPAIMGVDDIVQKASNDDLIIMDGTTGEVLIDPSQDVKSQYLKIKEEQAKEQEALKAFIGENTITKDGKKIELAANIAGLKDIKNALENDAEGIGLFRSEFIYMDRETFPTEKEQFEIYKEALEKFENKPMIIRTMDIGGDKEVDYLDFGDELNPFLGYRAVRYCLENQDVFKVQLRALLRASVYGKLKIMFPMISSVKEIRAIKELLESVKNELRSENLQYSDSIEIGIMIEIPSAAIMADKLAKEVDFFSIGTNDLIQYMTATDRMNAKLKHLYTPYHPGVLRVIQSVIEKAHNQGIWVGMCGSVAGNQDLIPVLIGMGLDEFSMSPSLILESRKLINSLDQNELSTLVEKVLDADDADAVKELL